MFTTWAAVLYQMIQTRADGEGLYFWVSTVVSQEMIKEEIILTEKIQEKVYVNHVNFVCVDTKPR